VETLCKSHLPQEEEVMKCKVCGREAVSDLCVHHAKAKERVQAAYPLWAVAYGRIDWEVYLDNVKRNPQTGQWAKEIAGYLLGG